MGLTACQCHYLSGIYLLHTLRPIEAWQSFFQASSLYAVYLKNQATLRTVRDTVMLGDRIMTDEQSLPDDLEHDLQQRLYWSCIKSESELCAEVNLPRSSLHDIHYPYQFPSPPTPRSVDGLDESPQQVTPSSSNNTTATISSSTTPGHYSEPQDFKELHEWSWYNYLSGISLFKLSGRVNQAFYSRPPSSWATMNLLDMINAAYEFEKQIEQWKLTLPQAISCFHTTLYITTVTELQLAPWLRSANIRLRIYRPFLYRLTCKIAKDWPLIDPMRHLAGKAVSLCLEPLFDLGLRHRNAESWFRCRESACRALLLICAGKNGLLRRMELEHRASETLQQCISHLRYWEREADDVRLARQTLEMMI
ncbi:unnamed protein product [Clonostachys chloroleuca]|uniref:Transcription factor domain-containing protein n=1 Tax=Clonostachys chloroleuca TaxID=1926264 RepID=A0AA35Q2S0_9HYPO|nr:unnamed protein product [Clonostachys chloroleuca]